MSAKLAEFFVVFFVKLAAALVESHKRKLKDEAELKAFDEVIERAKKARTLKETRDAAGEISDSL